MQPERTSARHVILCCNSGSSSVKFALYRLGRSEEIRLAHGAVERIGLADGHLWIQGVDNKSRCDDHRDFPDHAAAVAAMFRAARRDGFPHSGRRGPSGRPRRTGP